jgi:parallel beta-helix repeat protein
LQRNTYGIYLLNASPNIANNIISGSDYGIFAENSSPPILYNMMDTIAFYGIYAISGDSFQISNNTLMDSDMIFFDSEIHRLWLKNTTLIAVNTTFTDFHLEGNSRLETKWHLHIQVVDENLKPVEGAAVLIYDSFDKLVSTLSTDSLGWIESVLVMESQLDSSSITIYNPYHVKVIKGTLVNTTEVTVEEDTVVTIGLHDRNVVITSSDPVFPWALVMVIGFFAALGLGGLGIEIMKYGLLSLFLPLYSRIKKEKLLDQPTRYKIHGYIIGNPGAHFGLIKQELGIPNGQVLYHLKRLMKAHLIYSKEDGIRKRFYPVGFPKQNTDRHYFTTIQEKILSIVKDNSGISQKKVASKMGISRQVAGYHLTKMEQQGAIVKELVGRENRYYLQDMDLHCQ